eukprot:Phypoly_transcript_07389.p1 GENE.Phypoly_transcript_07389~~Phypoly_transcript_07389.p1  ORF type:complete len:459 (+),score=89.55 Phypoly_transcript_07389:251-1627(+)
MAGADHDELKVLISQTLESKGILGKIKAQLRASVVTAINEYEGLNNKIYADNVGAKKIQDQFEAQIGLGLVCEFLEFYGFQYTLSILLPEANVGERFGLPGIEQVSQYLRLHPSSKSQPLLVDLVASIKNSPATGHLSPAQSPHASYPQSPRASDPPASPRSPRAQPTHWPTKTNPHTPASSSNTPSSPTIKKLVIPPVNVPAQPLQPLSTTKTHPPLQNSALSHPQSSILQAQMKAQATPLSTQKKDAIPTVSDVGPKKNFPKNKEAAYLSYPEGEEDDIDEEIDEDLYDLDGDLDFEDDEDIEIDATPPKKPEEKNAKNVPTKAPLTTLTNPTTQLQSKDPISMSNTTFKVPKSDYEEGLEDNDPGLLEEDMKRLSVIEQKLNLFSSSSSLQSSSLSNKLSLTTNNNNGNHDDDLDSIGSDYSNSFASDEALTTDHSIPSSPIGGRDYDHEEDVEF